MLEPAQLEEALARMPHRGAMRLIEIINSVDPTGITCKARAHDRPDYPLRLDGHLAPVALSELGAQAAAAHASLYGMGAAHTGLVLSLTGVDVLQKQVPNSGNLIVHAERVRALDAAASYRFVVSSEGSAGDRAFILSGEVLLSMVSRET